MRATTRTRVEKLDAEQAAFVIEEFARYVTQVPGVWAVTIRRNDLKSGSVDLHLIVHADVDPDMEAKWTRDS